MSSSENTVSQTSPNTHFLKKQSLLTKWGPLFLISALSLFLELAVIRWVAGEVRLFAYFKNLPLLAAFLGLSIGFGLVGRGKDYRSSFALLLMIFVLLVIAFSKYSSWSIVYPWGQDTFFWANIKLSSWISLLLFFGTIAIFFLIIVFLFVPLGQLIGKEMTRHEPVPAYVVNILASLSGVWAFSLVSYLQTPPILWFGIFVLGFIFYKINDILQNRLNLLFLTLPLVAILMTSSNKVTWSPYNRLSLSENNLTQMNGENISVGYILNVQQVFYQSAINLSNEFVNSANNQQLDSTAFSYNLPYKLVKPSSKALIVGAGMGNDVAAAIRGDMESVTAVEIDPAIIDYGRKYHPEKPYQDTRVNLVVDDARSYFNTSTDKYDLIVFGLLDSHTLLSSMSSVRLDSFVYTIQSFEQVKRLLKEDGIVVLTFFVGEEWIGERIGRMMASVFGVERTYIYEEGLGSMTFVAGPLNEEQISQSQLKHWQPDPSLDSLPLSTDDWPYLYMRGRKIPAAYWQSLLLIGALCLVLVSRSFPEALRPDWHFWLLGAAFLLIEFKAITELALLFGTTWLVNSLAISGVLIMALLANLLVLGTKKINLRVVYIFLFISLPGSLIFPLDRLAGLHPMLRGVTSVFLLTMPLFFAGIIFSESLRRYGETSKPLASNFSGSAIGGILEYTSIWWGIKSLYLIATGLYFVAMLVSRKLRR